MKSLVLLTLAAVIGLACADGRYFVPESYYLLYSNGDKSPMTRLKRSTIENMRSVRSPSPWGTSSYVGASSSSVTDGNGKGTVHQSATIGGDGIGLSSRFGSGEPGSITTSKTTHFNGDKGGGSTYNYVGSGSTPGPNFNGFANRFQGGGGGSGFYNPNPFGFGFNNGFQFPQYQQFPNTAQFQQGANFDGFANRFQGAGSAAGAGMGFYNPFQFPQPQFPTQFQSQGVELNSRFGDIADDDKNSNGVFISSQSYTDENGKTHHSVNRGHY